MGALNDIRARAMDILARYKDVIDAADSSTGEKDGRFNVISFRNIANSPELPQDLRDAANLVADDEAMIRDIDGNVGVSLNGRNLNKPTATRATRNTNGKDTRAPLAQRLSPSTIPRSRPAWVTV